MLGGFYSPLISIIEGYIVSSHQFRLITEERMTSSAILHPGPPVAPPEPVASGPGGIIPLPVPSPTVPLEYFGENSTEVIAHTQRLLATVGCYSGPIDGLYGPRSKRALLAATKHLRTAPATKTEELIKALELAAARPEQPFLCRPPRSAADVRGQTPPEPAPELRKRTPVQVE